MKLELDKKRLMHLVNGIRPTYNLSDNLGMKNLGQWDANYCSWEWDISELMKKRKLPKVYNS